MLSHLAVAFAYCCLDPDKKSANEVEQSLFRVGNPVLRHAPRTVGVCKYSTDITIPRKIRRPIAGFFTRLVTLGSATSC